MNNDTFLIESDNLEIAQDICKYIENDTVRSRSVANAFAATIAKKYFSEIDVDIESGLYKNCKVLEDIEISDIYIKNNYIDVRIYFSDNDLCVPKANFDKEVLPLAYMFIRLDEELSSGNVTGFILPSMIDKSVDYNGYYKVSENDLISYYDVEAMLAEGFVFDIDEDFNSQIYDYLDQNLENKNYFYRVLLSSKEARELLYKATMANIVYNFVSRANNTAIADPEDNEEMSLDLNNTEEQDLNQDSGELEYASEDIEIDNLEEYSLDETENLTLVEDDSADGTLLEEFPNEETLEQDGFNASEELLESTTDSDALGITLEESQDDLNIISDEDNEFDLDIQESSEIEEEILEIQDAEDVIISEEDTLNVTNDVDSTQEEGDLPESNDLETAEAENFDFSTNVTPSMTVIENEPMMEVAELTENDLIDSNEEASQNIDNENNIEELVFEDAITDGTSSEEVNSFDEDKTEELETLFNDLENAPQNTTVQEHSIENYTNNESAGVDYDTYYAPKSNRGIGIIPVVGVATLIAAAGYFGYTKYFNQQEVDSTSAKTEFATTTPIAKKDSLESKKIAVDAMPIETVEKEVKLENKNEGLAVEIPAIEKNLDASILVSNLSIQWEVPAGYATNNTAKRYFTKMGKIIQLNLKTEMLLLNKPPITNKIVVELEFNNSLNKFNVKGLVASSGETTVDELIKKTVQNALDINLNMNMSVFNNIQGNPSLVIRL